MNFTDFLEKYGTKDNIKELKEDLKSLVIDVVKQNQPPMTESFYKDDLDLIDKILSIYCLSKGIVVRNFELKVLKYYIKYGYNDDAKKFLKEDENRKDGDIRVADTYLRRNGLLLHGETNFRKSTLSKDIEAVREFFISNQYKDKNKTYGILFKQKT